LKNKAVWQIGILPVKCRGARKINKIVSSFCRDGCFLKVVGEAKIKEFCRAAVFGERKTGEIRKTEIKRRS